MTDFGLLQLLSLTAFYLSYLYFVAAPFALWIAFKKPNLRPYAAAFLAIITSAGYARFVEPRILLTAEHDVSLNGCFDQGGQFRIAVFSDTHEGLFGNAMPIERITRRVNETGADFILVPGDFVYFMKPEEIEIVFADFSKFNVPVFAVLGNHDLGIPGPDMSAPLNDKLPGLGLRMIDDAALHLSTSRFQIELIGISDEWARNQDLDLLKKPPQAPRLVLTHHPETVFLLKAPMQVDLLVGGHTHGGQVQLPLITCWLTHICGNHAYGLRDEDGVLVFTTSGTGMVGLPLRFRVPPRIDVLNVSYNACAAQ